MSGKARVSWGVLEQGSGFVCSPLEIVSLERQAILNPRRSKFRMQACILHDRPTTPWFAPYAGVEQSSVPMMEGKCRVHLVPHCRLRM
jgi:hypothetical protein